MTKKILITGASGLMGKALVDYFIKKGFFVFAQYHKKSPEKRKSCRWLSADFSSLAGIRKFLQENKSHFEECTHLVNNYGPITVKNTRDLKSEDFMNDYYHNVVTTYEISCFLIRHSALQSVVNIGFEFAGLEKVYKTVLPYALAKNSLLLLTQSLAKAYPRVHFNLVSPATIEGAKVKHKSRSAITSDRVARVIYRTIISSSTAQNILVEAEKKGQHKPK